MLYITTRNSADTYTAHQTLRCNFGVDGGMFVPFRLPRISTETLLQMGKNSVNESVAQVLNMFFPGKLTAADVDACLSADAAKLVPMSHKIVLAELWHNDSYDVASSVNALASRILSADAVDTSTDWAHICCRIAFLFAIYGLLLSKGVTDGIRALDIAVCSGDFSTPMAAWYAREMGLPIGMIVCGCEESADVWDILHRGELHCTKNTPAGLERLVFGVFGQQEAVRFGKIRTTNGVYTSANTAEDELGQGMFAAVVSTKRMENVIRSVYRTNSCILSPRTAFAYGGLQDYRASRSESAPALILAEHGPLRNGQTVADALGITLHELKAKMH